MVMPEHIRAMMIRVKGNKEYLPVAARVLWFRLEHPNWGIHTEPVRIDNEEQFAIFRATIIDEIGKTIASATKREDVRGFGDYIEKAETGSVGRALVFAGYGTLAEEDEMIESVAARQVDGAQQARVPDNPLDVITSAMWPEKSAENRIAEVWKVAVDLKGKEPPDKAVMARWPVNPDLIKLIAKRLEELSNA